MVHCNWTVTNVPVAYVIILIFTNGIVGTIKPNLYGREMKNENTVKFICVTFRENNNIVTKN